VQEEHKNEIHTALSPQPLLKMPSSNLSTTQLQRPKAHNTTIKLFDTIKDAASGLECETHPYVSAKPAVDPGIVPMPEEIKGFTLPGASPMARDLARERVEAAGQASKPFAGLARWYKEGNDTKYSKDEWNHARDFISNSAVSRRRAATTARETTEKARGTTGKHLQKTGGVVRESLTERVSEIKKVIKQLRQGKKFVDTEIALMQHALKTMAAFVDNAFVFPINANSECCQLRDGRIGIDYVEDDVDIQLQRESEMLRGVAHSIVEIRQASRGMLDYLINVSEHLQGDIRAKRAATSCDHNLQKLKLDAKTLRLNLKTLDPESSQDWSTIDDWRGASEAMLQAGRDAVTKSKELRLGLAEQQQFVESKLKEFEMDVTASLRKRLVQYEEALGEDESILMQCQYEIATLQKEIKNIHDAIAKQTAPMKRNTTRLEKRGTARPGRERTTDDVNDSLIQEAAEISGAVDALRQELEINEENYVRLREMEAMLEEDIEIKRRSVRIEKKCIYQRSYFAKFKAEDAAKHTKQNPR